jgi:hypothetical protein
MKKYTLAVLAAAVASASMAANAEINFRGFGSIVGGQALEVDGGQSVLGYTDEFNFRRDSLMALQMDTDLEDGLSATMQLISRGKTNYEVDVEWAYLSYEISDGLQISAGRIRAPFYRYSDFLDVRYAYNWISAPARVYSFEFPGYDGLSLLYNNSVGPVDSSLQLIAGRLDDITDENNVPLLFEDMVGASWTGSWEWLTARASYLQSNVSIPERDTERTATSFEQLAAALNGVAAGFSAPVLTADGKPAPDATNRAKAYASGFQSASTGLLAKVDDIRIKKDKGTYMSVGFGVDKDSLIVDGEWVRYEAEDSLATPTEAYYVTLGWRVGPTVLYSTYSREQADAPLDIAYSITDLTPYLPSLATETLISPQLTQGAMGAIMGSQALMAGLAAAERDIVNVHVGVRWDFHPSAAFKVGYETSDNRISETKGGVFRTAIDVVF